MCAPNAAVDYSFHVAVKDVSNVLIDGIGECVEMGIPSFKVFMVYDFGVTDGVFFRVLQKAKEVGALIEVHAENNELVKMLTDALESFQKEGSFAFPAKIRPANESIASLCLQALRNAGNAANDAKSILLSNSRDELRKLLEAEGVKPTPEMLDSYWNSLLEAAPAAGAGVGADASGPAASVKSADDGGEATVYATSRAGKNWRYLARIDITTPGMEMFEIPLFPLEQGKTVVRGTGMAGGKWRAVLAAPRNAAEPRGAASFRLKRIEGKEIIDVMTWPSASNGWIFELRARPCSSASGNACLVEIGE